MRSRQVIARSSETNDREIVAWIDNVTDGFEGKRRKA
jgi:hypothetical protein